MSVLLNLSRRPFRNERAPTLGLALGCAGLLVASAGHVVVARDLAPGRSRDVATEVVGAEREIDALRAEAADLRKVEAPPDKLKEWAAVRNLVERRVFSWTGLFAALEEALPPGVKLVAVVPGVGGGATELKLQAVGRSNEDALGLMEALQRHPDFDGAFLNGWNEGHDGFDIACTVRYTPKARPAAPAAKPGAEATADPPAEGGE